LTLVPRKPASLFLPNSQPISTGSYLILKMSFRVVREGVGAGGRNEPSLVCTYE
jgi:hypothetical protein